MKLKNKFPLSLRTFFSKTTSCIGKSFKKVKRKRKVKESRCLRCGETKSSSLRFCSPECRTLWESENDFKKYHNKIFFIKPT